MSFPPERAFIRTALLCGLLACRIARSETPEIRAQIKFQYDQHHWTDVLRLSSNAPSPSAALLFYRGLALAQLDQLPAARSVLQQGRTMYPQDKRFPIELAGIAYRDGRVHVAKNDLRAALKIDPRDQYAADFLGTLYFKEENLPAALKAWNDINKPVIQTLSFAPTPGLIPELTERTFDISGGQIFTVDRLRKTLENVDQLSVFSSLQFDLLPANDDRFNLIIRAVPIHSPFSGWLGDVLPMLRELPYQAVDVDFLNIHGTARNFHSLWRWDPNKRRIVLGFDQPFHQDPRIEQHYTGDLRDEIWNLPGVVNGLILRSAELNAGFTFILSSKLRWLAGGRISTRDYSGAPHAVLFRNGEVASVDNRLDYLLLSIPENRMQVQSFALLDAGRFFGPNASRLVTTRAGMHGSWYPQARGEAWIVTERIEAGSTFGKPMLDQLFILGMERDNDRDLWVRGVVGTSGGRKGAAPMGRDYGITQSDLRRTLLQLPLVELQAGPFFDAGSIGGTSGIRSSKGFTYDTGVEADVKTAGSVQFSFVYGHDLSGGGNAFYTAVSRR